MFEYIPWYIRICAKLFLSRIPVQYAFWQKIGLFRHGRMDDLEYPVNVFIKHFSRVEIAASPPFTCLEIGPGDSLVSALIAYYYGAGQTILIDVGSFASFDQETCEALSEKLAKDTGRPLLGALPSSEVLLRKCNATYYTNGLGSLKMLESNSVDFIWSQAVLEHIRKDEMREVLRELHRILKPGGWSSHRIDLKDHLGGGLNNLRFSTAFWENDKVAVSGFYTNRIRSSELVHMFEASGFSVQHLTVDYFEKLPLSRSKLHPDFRCFSDDELLISGIDIVLRPLFEQQKTAS